MTAEQTTPGFVALGLASPVLAALESLNYSQPSPIQAQMIPLMLAGRDVIGQAQTGTGKTAAFALPLISRFAASGERHAQVLVLAPTRELALQVTESFSRYAANYPSMQVVSLCGGMDYRPQTRALRDGAQFVIGTPGRVIDHLTRGTLKLDQLDCLVLDEADEMLRMGFIEDVEAVLAAMPSSCQVALFSATMPVPIRKLAQKYLKNPEEVTIKSKTETVAAIRQRYLFVNFRDKMDALVRVLECEDYDGVIVFARTKESTVEIADALQRQNYRAVALNGDMPQNLREQTVDQLKNKRIDILVATDVVARGLDVPRISHVINYDISFDAETYVHRIGRTGRAGREGDAILFVTAKDKRLLQTIERVTRQKVEEMPLPTAADINAARERRLREQLQQVLAKGELEPFRSLLDRWKDELQVSPLELAAAMAVVAQGDREFHIEDRPATARAPRERDDRGGRDSAAPRVRVEYKERAPRRQDGERAERRPTKAPTAPEPGMARYRIAVGRKHGVKPANIVGAIANEANINSQNIGRIDIFPEFSTVDLPQSMPSASLQHLRNVWVSGQKLSISPWSDKPPAASKPRRVKVEQ
ncbi:MAG: DEAD/DEAH box helicase [Alcanivoracaceae bacterium]